MKIAILTSGTRGDVQPYIALGKALLNRGHDVLLACPDNFASWVKAHGLEFHSIGVDMQTFVQSPEGRKILSGNLFAFVKLWKQTIVPSIQKTLRATWDSAQDADIIIFHPKAGSAADVAEATDATLVSAVPFPIFPTKAFPFLVIKGNYGPWLNRLSYLPLSMSRMFFLRMINRWRVKTLGLGKGPSFMPIDGIKGGLGLRLCAVSPSIVQYPNDGDNGVYTTGYWFLDEGQDWQPDSELLDFIKAGTPPVYIGFGSMPSWEPKKLTKVVIEAVRRAKVRAILAIGWGGLKEIDLPDFMHIINEAPHDALFKHVGAVVHHGGAGTTAAGLRAGLPTLICHSAFDQPYWGRQIYAIGCGPKPQSLKRLKAKRFAKGLIELTRTKSFGIRAAKIARAIEKEDGITTAIELIEATHEKIQETH
jgi:sterol 3beta-glucosyltransferase